MVSVAGNLYSVPDATRRRVVEVQNHPGQVRIFEDGALIAAHPVLEGRNRRRLDPSHRTAALAAPEPPAAVAAAGDARPALRQAARPGARARERPQSVFHGPRRLARFNAGGSRAGANAAGGGGLAISAGNAPGFAVAKWLTTTARVLPVVIDGLFHTRPPGRVDDSRAGCKDRTDHVLTNADRSIR